MKRLWLAVVGRLQLRLLLIGSLPLLLATGLFTSYAIFSRQGDPVQRVELFGVRTADYLAQTLDFALFSKDPAVLGSIAGDLQAVPGILGVVLLDHERRVLHGSSGFPGDQPWRHLRETLGGESRQVEDALLVERPVRARGWNVEDYPGAAPISSGDDLLGWVVVALDLSAAKQEERGIVIRSMGIGAGVLGTALLMSVVLANSVVAPIRTLTSTVARLREGDLQARAPVSTRDELADLATGINHLGETVSRNQLELEQRVASATHELRNALDELRRKNEELEIAAREAEAANLAKSDFLARMSHELRTPLTSIQGFVRLLESTLSDAADRNYCRIIDHASQSLIALIDDILELSRLQSATPRVEWAPFDLRETLEATVRLLAPTAHGKGVEMYLEIDSDLVDRPISDGRALRQIVNNLVANAAKFTAVGHVHVTCTRLTDDCLRLVVRDSGIGIAVEQQEQIFAAFQQADSGIARRFGGSGLGLAIAHEHVQLLNGKLELHSQLGEGSEFCVEIPCRWLPSPLPLGPPAEGIAVVYDVTALGRNATCATMGQLFREVQCVGSFDDLIDAVASRPIKALNINWALNEPASTQLTELGYLLDELRCPIAVQVPLATLRRDIPDELVRRYPHARWLGKPAGLDELRAVFWGTSEFPMQMADLSGVRVLVVEDNPLSRLLLGQLLARTGCDYLEVAGGHAAIEVCAQQKFDVILLDLHMPEITGVQVLVQVQAGSGLNADTPVIVITADHALDAGRALSQVSATRILGKPYDERRLLEALLELSGRRGALPAVWIGRGGRVSGEVYHDEVNRLVTLLEEAFAARDLDNARELCHQLVGVTAMLPDQALGLNRQALVLQSLMRLPDWERATTALQQLKMSNAVGRSAEEPTTSR